MGLSISSIVLYSRNPESLIRFLSHLLELEIRPSGPEEAPVLLGEKIRFHILKASAQHLFQKAEERDITVDFELSELSELEDLLHKVQFMEYRQVGGEQDSLANAKTQLSKKGPFHFFWLQDPDGRQWKFSYCEK